MHVILNSDVLWVGHLMKQLTAAMRTFCECVRDHGVTIVVPLTTLLEYNHAQRDCVESERRRIGKAVQTLQSIGVEFDPPDIDAHVPTPDLLKLLEEAGARATVAKPTPDELVEAHRRACSHEPPLPPGTKSNEMRDVVIWLVALRYARQHGRALLISRDKVHTGPQAQPEAEKNNLLVANDFDQGLEHLNLASPSTSLVRELLAPMWSKLTPNIEEPVEVQIVSNTRFVHGPGYVTEAQFNLQATTGGDKTLVADARYRCDGKTAALELRNVSVDKQKHPVLMAEADAPTPDAEYLAQLDSLRDVLRR